ncbi:MAG TPA: 3-methyl-2-oxobutanoate hydroxymethyltransferase [Nakamurella sp.]|nr:3-methyl-2-oxobutanoate hydroxymethyltransferase [Nakamurella sp.]
MSTRPSPEPGRSPVTIPGLLEQKRSGRPIVMVTAYDYPSARAAESAGVDVVLVGDSGAMTVLGHPSTVSVTVDEMLMLTKAARRGVDTALFVADLPFGSYEVSDEQAIATAVRFVKEAGADGVKLERGGPNSVSRARAVVGAGIPVMGHVGLTPQTATSLGGYRAQGRSAESALSIARGALDLQAAGCFGLVFEAVPSVLTQDLMQLIRIPVIGIGAGPATDGQVLVFHDLLGIRDGVGAKFVRRYADLQDAMNAGVARYAEQVRSGAFPAAEHGYGMDPAELDRYRARRDEIATVSDDLAQLWR